MVLITPYCKFSDWIMLEKKLREAIGRKVEIEFYIRDGESNESRAEVRSLGIEPHLVKTLHAKLYFNEKQAIVTSMDILSDSETDSIELGYFTENVEEYSELMSFFNRYIKSVDLQNETGLNSEFHKKNNDWLTPLILNLNAHNASPSEVLIKENNLVIKIAADEYNCFIDNEKGNFFRMKLDISKKDYRNFIKLKHLIEKKSRLTVELFDGDGHHSPSIWGQASRLKSKDINLPGKEEIETIISQIINFILTIEEVRREQEKV